jgi:hypothetical protein
MYQEPCVPQLFNMLQFLLKSNGNREWENPLNKDHSPWRLVIVGEAKLDSIVAM